MLSRFSFQPNIFASKYFVSIFFVIFTKNKSKAMLINSVAILCVLSFNIYLAFQLERIPQLKALSASLIVIILGALEVNFGLLPTSSSAPPLYDGIFAYVAPLLIVFLMLGIQLKSLKKAGLPMILNYLLGSLGVMVGVALGILAVNGRQSLGENFHVVGGMVTATYIGGSTNLNAVALTYNFAKEGTLYAAISAVDNIITALWLGACILIPKLMKKRFPTKRQNAATTENYSEAITEESTINPSDLGILIALGCAILFTADQLSLWKPSIHRIIWLSTLSLLLAQVPFVQKLRGSRTLGMFCSYLFLSVIGVFCDIQALLKDGQTALTLAIFITIVITVHAFFQFVVGYFLKQDWDIMGIASQANVGGATTALSVAKSLDREDLGLGGIMIGLLGNAIGTYLGVLMAEFLKAYF
jgi:uncharacterized membrane protein